MSKFLNIILILLLTCIFTTQGFSQEAEEMVKILLKGKKESSASESLYDLAYEKVRSETKLEDAVKKILIKRLDGIFKNRFLDVTEELHLLRAFGAKEALPMVKGWWDRPARISVHRLSEDLHLQMLNAISEWLPEKQSIEFLKEVLSDTIERPRVRLEAILLLFRHGGPDVIDHVINLYFWDKQKYDNDHVNIEGMGLRHQDQDYDGMEDYIEANLLLDPNDPDSDGDSILDGQDHNPLCLFEGNLTSEQIMAQYIVYLFTTYEHVLRILNCKTLIIPEQDFSNGKKNLLWGLEYGGVDALFLHYTEEQLKKYWDLFEYGPTILTLSFIKDQEPKQREYELETVHEKIRIVVKDFSGIWLPIQWEKSLDN